MMEEQDLYFLSVTNIVYFFPHLIKSNKYMFRETILGQVGGPFSRILCKSIPNSLTLLTAEACSCKHLTI